jgi:hypothetical protein
MNGLLTRLVTGAVLTTSGLGVGAMSMEQGKPMMEAKGTFEGSIRCTTATWKRRERA